MIQVEEGLFKSSEYSNHSYQIFKVPPHVIEEVDNITKNLSNNFSTSFRYQERLAGEIQHEYGLDIETVPLLTDFTIRALTDYENNTNLLMDSFRAPMLLLMDNFWVNFQQKGEYNPLHSHSGVYSYVYWHKVPYTYEEEEKSRKSSSLICQNGLFNFHSTNEYMTVGTTPLKVDKTAEGYMCVFPSTLAHSVHPFYTSDDYRITIAGNVIAVTQQGYPIKNEDGLLHIQKYKDRINQVATAYKIDGYI